MIIETGSENMEQEKNTGADFAENKMEGSSAESNSTEDDNIKDRNPEGDNTGNSKPEEKPAQKPRKEPERRCQKCGRVLDACESHRTICRRCKRNHWKKMNHWMMGVGKYPGGLH